MLVCSRNVFVQRDDVLRLARGVPDKLVPPARNDDAAIAPDEALCKFILVMFPLDEFRVPFCAGGAVIRVNNLVPLL